MNENFKSLFQKVILKVFLYQYILNYYSDSTFIRYFNAYEQFSCPYIMLTSSAFATFLVYLEEDIK